MSSILTNANALSALQALQMTQQEMAQTQNQVSTGLAVASAADNAAYWSIGTQLNSDSGVVTAANSALTQSQSVLDTASSAISSIVTTIKAIQTALTEATNPGADIGNIQTTLTQLGNQLSDAVNGASFNGLNVTDGSQSAAALNFVSGFNATATGGTINTINFTTLALISTTSGGQAATPPLAAGSGILEGGTGAAAGGGQDLLTLGTFVTDAATANTALAGVATVLNSVTNYAATIGATQDRMTAASTFNTALSTDYANGVSGLVDANMNTASTRLQALQTQEQLGIQSLSIANQNAQLILKLFP
jgi:flagellin